MEGERERVVTQPFNVRLSVCPSVVKRAASKLFIFRNSPTGERPTDQLNLTTGQRTLDYSLPSMWR